MPSPAVKLPLLVCSSIFTHLNWTAPNPPPNREECAKFNTGTSPQEYGPYTLLDCATLLKVGRSSTYQSSPLTNVVAHFQPPECRRGSGYTSALLAQEFHAT